MDSGWGHLIFGGGVVVLSQKRLWNEVVMACFGSTNVRAGEGEGCWTEGCGGCFGRQRNPPRAISIYTIVRVALHYSYHNVRQKGNGR